MFILANLEKTIKKYTQKIIAYILLNNLTPFEIQVLSTSAIKCRGKFRIFQFASAMCQQKKTAENLLETFVYHVGNGFGVPRHVTKDYDFF